MEAKNMILQQQRRINIKYQQYDVHQCKQKEVVIQVANGTCLMGNTH